ncbi:MAG: PD-(D/E)XK nuclease family protein [Acidobacteriota bacterium]
MDATPAQFRAVSDWSNSFLIAEAQDFLRRYTEVLLVGPSGASNFKSSGSQRGSAGIHRVSFLQMARQLAQPALAEFGLAPVSNLGTEALASRVAFQIRKENALVYFEPVAALPGFSRALARTLRELRLAGVTPDQLAAGAPPARDLSLLLQAYEHELTQRSLADLARILALATQAAVQGVHRWAGLPAVFLDVDLPTQAHRQLLEAVTRAAPHSLVLTLGPGRADAPAPTNSLDHLRRNLFKTSSAPFPSADGRFDMFSAPGEGLESVEIARRILAFAKAGTAFDQIAILVRNPDRYQPMIGDALQRAGIPAYFSRGTTRPDPAGRAFLALLGCAAENLSASRFAEYMSLGQIPQPAAPSEWVPPEDELLAIDPAAAAPAAIAEEPNRPTPRRWERYLVDAAVIGGRDRWERRLRGLEAEWELQDNDNAERVAQLRNLREFALPLIDLLAELPANAPWSDFLEALGTLARRSLRTPDGVLAVLADLAPMGEVGPVTLEEVIEVLGDRLRFLRRDPPGRRWGQVFVGSVDEARGREFAVVFLPGLAEGLFPQRLSEDPLLLDEFRKAIDSHLLLKQDRGHEERHRLHLAVAAARDRLIASYPRMEVAEARPRVPSFYALELPRAIYGQIPELKVFEKDAREAAPTRLNWPAPRLASDAIDDAEYDLASLANGAGHHILQSNEYAARSLRSRWRRWNSKWHSSDGLIASQEGTLAALATHRLAERSWSPSALENFATCPYKFALHGIYRLRPREEIAPLEQLDPRTRGSLFHAVQYELFQDLQAAQQLPVTADNLTDALARLEVVLSRVANKYVEQLAPAIPRVWDSEIEELRTDLRGWLHFAASNESDWEPILFELPFEAQLAEGVKLHGRIDLVERRNGVLRVTDHKTGKRPEMIPRWVGGGKHLQPLLYAAAVEQVLGLPVEAGRLLYATQRGGYTPIEIRMDERARQFLGKLLLDIDGMIAGGFLPPIPDKEVCEYCDYRVVCGPYEERRLSKKDRQDERLDPLYEIRGMA